jgi:hypothetical protein
MSDYIVLLHFKLEVPQFCGAISSLFPTVTYIFAPRPHDAGRTLNPQPTVTAVVTIER